jgi:hypothetical protein
MKELVPPQPKNGRADGDVVGRSAQKSRGILDRRAPSNRGAQIIVVRVRPRRAFRCFSHSRDLGTGAMLDTPRGCNAAMP